MFKQGAFQIDPNATPEQIATKRALIAAMAPKYGSAKYVGEGLGQLFYGIGSGRQERRLDATESAGTKSANDLFARIFGTANSAQSPDMGPLSVLGPTDPWVAGAEAPAGPDPTKTYLGMPDVAEGGLSFPGQPKVTPEGSSGLSFGSNVGQSSGGSAEAIFRETLLAGGLPAHAVEGIMMNAHDESAFNPNAVGDSGAAFGMLQWNGPRKRALEKFAAENGENPADPAVQAKFTLYELQGPESAAGRALLAAGTAGEAGAAFVNHYERPAESHRARREAAYLGGGGRTAGSGGSSAGAAAPAPTSAPSIPINELYMALQNPWLSGEQKGLITSMIQEQQQASDPLRQLQIAQAEAELAKTNAPAAPPEELTTRMMLAEQAGLEQGTPEYQTYLLTGELPEQAGSNVPAGFATLDMQAQAAGYAPGTPEYQEFMRNGGASGTPAAFTALDLQARAAGYEPGTPEYQRFMASRGAYERSSDAAIGKAQGEDAALYESMTSKMPGLESVVDELSAIADEATYTSTGQAANWIGKQLGFEPSEAAVARTKYIAMVDNQVLPMLRDTFGAAFTVAEGESLRATLGDPNKTPEEKKVVLEAFIEQKKRDVEALGRRVNGSETPAAPATGATVPITSDAEYDALPSGTMFQGPDGKVRRKP
jgi:hypothetical protein